MPLSRLQRALRRCRGRRLAAAQRRLDMCPDCGEAFVYPVSWAESGPADWWLFLRCGSCGASRDLVVSNATAAEYDSRLDEGMAAIHATANRLQNEALALYADTLAAALRLDLLGADDFR